MMSWYRKVLKDYSREAIISVGITLLTFFIMAIFQLVNGGVFAWNSITPIEQPDLFSRIIYSALTYFSLGAIIYHLLFYKLLSWLFGSDRRGYREAKQKVWIILMLVMYFIVVPKAIEILNAIISFCYNVLILLVYVSPAAFLILLCAVLIAIRIKTRNRMKHKKLI